ncbi:hypothetical protein CJO94_05865 [Ralstonia solanacearum]|nr:hypothetical protein CJO94_05865 [Ralstonia solanacearum]
MTPQIEMMRGLLEARDVAGFLSTYAEHRQQHAGEPALTSLSQRVLPPLLREAFAGEQLSASTIVLLWRMVRDHRLVLVENDLLVAINQRIDKAIAEVEPDTKLPAQPLATFQDQEVPRNERRSTGPVPSLGSRVEVTEVKRVAIASAFSIGVWSAVDAFDYRKNVCASQQQREFLQAVRQYFPSLRAYPNLPLRNFVDNEKLESMVPLRVRNYAWSAQVDVLLCTEDEDPVAGVELDSVHHDAEDVAERDELKNLLFKLAGLPLLRIRADDAQAVRAEDFYDLLMTQSEALDVIRPRRLRPRRTHDFLVPAESSSKEWVSKVV